MYLCQIIRVARGDTGSVQFTDKFRQILIGFLKVKDMQVFAIFELTANC